MRRQRYFRIVIFRDENRGSEIAVVEQRLHRDIAAGGGNEEQNRDAPPLAAISQGREKVIAKTPVAMAACTRFVAERRQQIAHAAMGVNMIGVGTQRRFKVKPRLPAFAEQQQQVGEIDVAVRIIGMMPHRLAEQRARGFPITGIENQRAEIVERGKIRRLAANKIEVVALRLLEPAFFAQQSGAFGERRNVVGISLKRQIKLADANAP